MSDFNRAIEFTLHQEGEYTNRSEDLGGETCYGVAVNYWPNDAKKIISLYKTGEKDEAKKEAILFYRREFWAKIQGDKLRWPLGVVMLDSCVNLGIPRGVKLLQKECNQQLGSTLKMDGDLGPKTLQVIGTVAPLLLSLGIIARRLKYHVRRPKSQRDVFLTGWADRCADLLICSYGPE